MEQAQPEIIDTRNITIYNITSQCRKIFVLNKKLNNIRSTGWLGLQLHFITGLELVYKEKKQTRLMALKPDYPGKSAPEMYIEGFRETNEYVSQLRN